MRAVRDKRDKIPVPADAGSAAGTSEGAGTKSAPDAAGAAGSAPKVAGAAGSVPDVAGAAGSAPEGASAGADSAAGASEGASDSARARSPRPRKRWAILGAVVAIVAVAAAGFNAWHAQPTFCNAVCHDPMDAYVEGYLHDGESLAFAHGVAGKTCLDCHPATLKAQVEEATSWVFGSFETDAQEKLSKSGVAFGYRDCAKSGCHDFESVIAATEDWGGEVGVNPHYSHQFYGGHATSERIEGSEGAFAMDCSNCHVSHGTSVLWCNSCHDFEVPAGWINPGA